MMVVVVVGVGRGWWRRGRMMGRWILRGLLLLLLLLLVQWMGERGRWWMC
jgi:hypothetical protein